MMYPIPFSKQYFKDLEQWIKTHPHATYNEYITTRDKLREKYRKGE